MPELVRPSPTAPDLQALMTALGQMLVPEYFRQKTSPLEYPATPGKMPAVENDPMVTSAFGGLDLIGNLAPMGGAKLAGPAIAALAAKSKLPAIGAKELVQTGHTPAEIEAILQSIEKDLANIKPPAASIAPVTNWAEEVPAAFKQAIAPVISSSKPEITPHVKSYLDFIGISPKDFQKMPQSDQLAMAEYAYTQGKKDMAEVGWQPTKNDFESQLAALQDALAGPTPGAKPTLAKAATDFPNPNIPPVSFQQVPLENSPVSFSGKQPSQMNDAEFNAFVAGLGKKGAPIDPALNAYDLEQAKLLMPKNPVSEPERQARMAASPYQTPTFHGTHSPFEGNTVSGGEFFSTPNPKLSELYAGDAPVFDNYVPQMLPLRLDTSKYHSVNAGGQTWDQINRFAVNEARARKAPGVEIRNVLDEPQSGSHSDYKEKLPPQTVYITLDPSTVRSDKAQFDPSKFHLNDLLAALGLGLLAPGAMGGSNASK